MSADVLVKNPRVSKLFASGRTPSREKRPWLGLNPVTPQNDAGRRTDPLVWVPRAKGRLPRRRSGCRPAGASAWGVLQVPGIAGRGGRAIGESCTLRFSQQDGSPLPQVTNNGGVGSPDASLVNWRAVFSRQASGFHDVFCPERNLC